MYVCTPGNYIQFIQKENMQINLFEYSNQQFISFVIQGSGIISENFMNKIIRWTHAIKMLFEEVAVFTCYIVLVYSGHMSLYIGWECLDTEYMDK